MNIGLCHYRGGETDGVSLEMEKWKKVLEEKGHNISYFIGNDGVKNSFISKNLNYKSQRIKIFAKNSYEKLEKYKNEDELKSAILEESKLIESELELFIKKNKIDIIIPNNILSLGLSIPAAIAFYNTIKKLKIKCIAHHHDFYWERYKYQNPTCEYVRECLDKYFPPKDKLIKHVVINKIAKNELKKRKNIDSVVVPNIFDFNGDPFEIDEYNKDFKKTFGIKKNDIIFLQATRIVERKAIELAIDLIGELNKKENLKQLYEKKLYDGRKFTDKNKIYLVMIGMEEAEKANYINLLRDKAKNNNVTILIINDHIKYNRIKKNEKKIYNFWDAYAFSDIITYPSLLEGWGNQFLEGIFAKKPLVIFEYPVFLTDIKEKKFNTVSLGSNYKEDSKGMAVVDNKIIKKATKECIKLLTETEYRESYVEQNFSIGRHNFSHQALYEILNGLLK